MTDRPIPPRVLAQLRAVRQQAVNAQEALTTLCMVTAESMGIDTSGPPELVTFDLDAGVIRVSDVE